MNSKRLSISLLVVFLSAIFHCAAQNKMKPNPVLCFNQLQHSVDEKNIDSAFYYAQTLALLNIDLLNLFIHDVFAQAIVNQRDSVVNKQILQKMYTGNTSLKGAVYPLYKWVDAQENVQNPVAIKALVGGFMVAQDRSEEEQGNRIDRYAFLIYNLLKQRPDYAYLADTLYTHTHHRLEHAVNGIYYQPTDDRKRNIPRAYFRYLMAYANSVKADEMLLKKELTRAEFYLKEASQFSPDDNDRQVRSAYFYESLFLLNGADDFHDRYASFLLAKGDTVAAINVLTDLTLADPGVIGVLRKVYQKSAASSLTFSDYWTKTLNAKLKPVESFRLETLDRNIIDYEKYRGKWILIDFWGTWCKPCVEELPGLQTFYRDQQKTPENLIVFTVACHDTEVQVREFLKKNQYNFPVVMANDKLLKQFRVGEYPTKVLITPQGNRMKIPFGVNWAERVKIYLAN